MPDSWASMRQETLDLAAQVGVPSVGDVLIVVPGCDQAIISPGMWANQGAGVWSQLITESGFTTVVLTCPENGHEHRDVQIIRATSTERR